MLRNIDLLHCIYVSIASYYCGFELFETSLEEVDNSLWLEKETIITSRLKVYYNNHFYVDHE